jgi:hypothetical protein
MKNPIGFFPQSFGAFVFHFNSIQSICKVAIWIILSQHGMATCSTLALANGKVHQLNYT